MFNNAANAQIVYQAIVERHWPGGKCQPVLDVIYVEGTTTYVPDSVDVQNHMRFSTGETVVIGEITRMPS